MRGGKAKKTAAKKTAIAAKTTAASKKSTMSKAEFVRSRPRLSVVGGLALVLTNKHTIVSPGRCRGPEATGTRRGERAAGVSV